MVDIKREGLGLLLKLLRQSLKSEDTTESTETTEKTEAEDSTSTISQVEPMKVYWETDKRDLGSNNQQLIDLFLKGSGALDRIPDATESPVKESQYQFEKFNLAHLPETLKNFEVTPDPPKTGTGISSSGRDAGVVAGIVVAVISGVIILAALIAAVMYRHYVHRNVTSMNFDNPVYRKTTEDQFALEKNGYAPGSKLYPSTVGEEAQEPLNTPGTNDFV